MTAPKVRRPCELCGDEAASSAGGCTNSRCAKCHATECTGGGEASPGHGRGTAKPKPKNGGAS